MSLHLCRLCKYPMDKMFDFSNGDWYWSWSCNQDGCNYRLFGSTARIDIWNFDFDKYEISCTSKLKPPFDCQTTIDWTDDQTNCQCQSCVLRKEDKEFDELIRQGWQVDPRAPGNAILPCPCVHSLTIPGIVLEPATTTLLRIQTIITFQ